MIQNLADVEDAVQEVFIEIWKNAGRYEPTAGSEATFISTIARRRLIDRHRRKGRELDTAALPDESLTPGFETEDRVELSEEADRAKAAMRKLRPEEQQVLELSIYQGLSQSQIATHTDLPLGTVKTHARRGLQRLRELLSEEPVLPTGRD
jgi:RNA polymerase sigma-70 factor (ECF subfamily)